MKRQQPAARFDPDHLIAPGIAKVPTTRPLPRLKPLPPSICLRLDNGKLSALTLRGVSPMSCWRCAEMHLVQGRMFKSGLREHHRGQGRPRSATPTWV